MAKYRPEISEGLQKDGFLPVQDVAETVGVDATTLHRWFRENKIEGRRLTNRYLYVKIDSVLNYLYADIDKP